MKLPTLKSLLGAKPAMSAIDHLLNPINDNAPCGEDLTFTADLDAIAEARRFDDPTLDQGEWVTDIKEADWPFVEQYCKKCKYTIDIDDDKLHQPTSTRRAIQAGGKNFELPQGEGDCQLRIHGN